MSDHALSSTKFPFKAPKTTSRHGPSRRIKLPFELYKRLRKLAERERRSIHQLMNFAIEDYVKRSERAA